MTREKIEKKINIAIDKMIDLKDSGHGNDKIERILESLNELRNELCY